MPLGKLPPFDLPQNICVSKIETPRKALSNHLKVASFACGIGVRIGLALITDSDGTQPYLDLCFVKPLMRFNNLTTSPRKRSKYRCGGFERILADNRRQLCLGPGCRHGAVEFGSPSERNIDGFLGSEEAFGHLQGRIPACFEHKVSLFAERGPAAINSVL